MTREELIKRNQKIVEEYVNTPDSPKESYSFGTKIWAETKSYGIKNIKRCRNQYL